MAKFERVSIEDKMLLKAQRKEANNYPVLRHDFGKKTNNLVCLVAPPHSSWSTSQWFRIG